MAQEEVKLIIWADEFRAPILREVGQLFTQEYGIPIEISEMGLGDIRERLAVAGPAGEGPDIIIGPHDWLGFMLVNGLVEPIPFMERIKDQFVTLSIEVFTREDKIYALPYAVEAIGLIHNTDLVPEPPETFEELIEIAKGLNDPATGTRGFLSHLSMPDGYHSFPFFTAFDGYVFGENPDGTYNPCDIGLANEGSIKAGEYLQMLVQEDVLMPGTDYGTMMSKFNEGKVGMILNGPWAIASIREAGINFSVAKLPTIEGNPARPFLGVHAFWISAFARQKGVAFVFLKDFIANKETMMELFEREPRPPAYIPALDEVSEDPVVKGFSINAGIASPMPDIPQMGAVWTAWKDAIDLIVNQGRDSKTVLEGMVVRIKETIGCPIK